MWRRTWQRREVRLLWVSQSLCACFSIDMASRCWLVSFKYPEQKHIWHWDSLNPTLSYKHFTESKQILSLFLPFFFRFLMQQTQQENDETLFKILWRRMLLRWNYLLFLHIYIPVGTFKMYCADWSYYLKPWKSLYIYHIYFAEQRDRHGGKQHYWTDLYFPRSCWITIFN